MARRDEEKAMSPWRQKMEQYNHKPGKASNHGTAEKANKWSSRPPWDHDPVDAMAPVMLILDI